MGEKDQETTREDHPGRHNEPQGGREHSEEGRGRNEGCGGDDRREGAAEQDIVDGIGVGRDAAEEVTATQTGKSIAWQRQRPLEQRDPKPSDELERDGVGGDPFAVAAHRPGQRQRPDGGARIQEGEGRRDRQPGDRRSGDEPAGERQEGRAGDEGTHGQPCGHRQAAQHSGAGRGRSELAAPRGSVTSTSRWNHLAAYSRPRSRRTTPIIAAANIPRRA